MTDPTRQSHDGPLREQMAKVAASLDELNTAAARVLPPELRTTPTRPGQDGQVRDAQSLVERLHRAVIDTMEAITGGELTVEQIQGARADARALAKQSDRKIGEAGALTFDDQPTRDHGQHDQGETPTPLQPYERAMKGLADALGQAIAELGTEVTRALAKLEDDERPEQGGTLRDAQVTAVRDVLDTLPGLDLLTDEHRLAERVVDAVNAAGRDDG